ncbi:conserved exported hypothetical protein [Candidatus Zixiibacteriota bacterium]|nr:conserved exported hypothetical protein [candidate division Zixibacteria bacterium]
MTRKLWTILALSAMAIMIAISPVAAKDRPIQLALISPIQLYPATDAVSGIRLSLIYGKNTSITGFDWGLVNHTTSGKSTGVQFGLVGLSDADFSGWQGNAINIVQGNFEGLQWGFVNHAYYANGLQLGFVNYARKLKGLQIGLVNIIKEGGAFPVFPIVNWSF